MTRWALLLLLGLVAAPAQVEHEQVVEVVGLARAAGVHEEPVAELAGEVSYHQPQAIAQRLAHD